MKRWFWMAGWFAAAVAQAADVPAVLQWSQRVELSTPVSGVVQMVNVAVGERARKGQVLLQLDDRVYAGRTEEAAAVVTRRQEEAAEATRDLQRVQELYDRSVISESELDQAKLRQARTAAQRKEARARSAQEARSRADTVLRAPFDALVVARMAEPGQAVAAGLQPQPLLAVAKAGEMLARALVGEVQISRLKVGQEVSVSVARQNFSGKIKTLALEPLPKDKGEAALYAVDVLFSYGDAVLRAGAVATIVLP